MVKKQKIELKEGKDYFIRYWKKSFFNRKKLKQLHGRLIEINLDGSFLIFKTSEYYGDFFEIPYKDVITTWEIKSKGKRLFE